MVCYETLTVKALRTVKLSYFKFLVQKISDDTFRYSHLRRSRCLSFELLCSLLLLFQSLLTVFYWIQPEPITELYKHMLHFQKPMVLKSLHVFVRWLTSIGIKYFI